MTVELFTENRVVRLAQATFLEKRDGSVNSNGILLCSSIRITKEFDIAIIN